MASVASHASFLPPVLTFCGAAVIAVPIFRFIGLSAVLGYLAAGIVIGPSGLKLVGDPETIATVGTRRGAPALHHRPGAEAVPSLVHEAGHLRLRVSPVGRDRALPRRSGCQHRLCPQSRL